MSIPYRFYIPPDLERENSRYGEKYLDVGYFNSGSHRTMIQDQVRTLAYHDAMVRNKFLFKDKIVMDVGCGTGILSYFATKAGAKTVIAIESTDMADYTKQVMEENGVGHIVHVVKDKLENITSLPDGITEVDIIISEFMGYSFFFESMMESVLYAREKWLKKPGGLMFPDRCIIYGIGVSDWRLQKHYSDDLIHYSTKEEKEDDTEERIIPYNHSKDREFPKVVDHKLVTDSGASDSEDEDFVFDFTPIRNGRMQAPIIYHVLPELCVTNSAKLFDLNLKTLTPGMAQGFAAHFDLDVSTKCEINGIALYFEVVFPQECHNTARTKFSFSTGPFDPPTHWQQAVYMLNKNIPVEKENKINGIVKFTKNKACCRDWDITFELKCGTGDGQYFYNESQDYASSHVS